MEIFSDYWLSIHYSSINNRSLVVKRKWFLENQFNIRFDLLSRQGSTEKHSHGRPDQEIELLSVGSSDNRPWILYSRKDLKKLKLKKWLEILLLRN